MELSDVLVLNRQYKPVYMRITIFIAYANPVPVSSHPPSNSKYAVVSIECVCSI